MVFVITQIAKNTALQNNLTQQYVMWYTPTSTIIVYSIFLCLMAFDKHHFTQAKYLHRLKASVNLANTFWNPLWGLRSTISETFQHQESHPLHRASGEVCGGVEVVDLNFSLKPSFFHSLHNYFCHFSCVQQSSTLWMPSRKDPKLCTIVPVFKQLSHLALLCDGTPSSVACI